MTREENILKERFGKENPFKVPDGYFDHLTERIMENLPEQEIRVIDIRSRQTLWQKLPLRKIAAAVAAVVLLGGGMLVGLQHAEKDNGQMVHASHTAGIQSNYNSEDASFDQMADYAMMDSQDFYAQLVAEN